MQVPEVLLLRLLLLLLLLLLLGLRRRLGRSMWAAVGCL
jgi:hypothetical protein